MTVRAPQAISNGRAVSYVEPQARARRDHPLRAIRAIVNEPLSGLEGELAGSIRGSGDRRSRRRSCRRHAVAAVLFKHYGAGSNRAAAGRRSTAGLTHSEEASIERYFGADGTLIEALGIDEKPNEGLVSRRRKAADAIPKRTSVARNVRTPLML